MGNPAEALSPQQRAWAEKQFQKIGASLAAINKLGLCDKYKKKFGIAISPNTLYQRLYAIARKKGVATPKTKSPLRKEYIQNKKIDKAVMRSSYFVHVIGHGVSWFETQQEVETYIKTLLLTTGMTVFKKVDVKVDHKIDIAFGK